MLVLVKGEICHKKEVRCMILIPCRMGKMISLLLKTINTQHVIESVVGNAKWYWRTNIFRVICRNSVESELESFRFAEQKRNLKTKKLSLQRYSPISRLLLVSLRSDTNLTLFPTYKQHRRDREYFSCSLF